MNGLSRFFDLKVPMAKKEKKRALGEQRPELSKFRALSKGGARHGSNLLTATEWRSLKKISFLQEGI